MALLLDKLNPQHEVEIETPRLRLRAVCASDLHTLHAIRTDPAVMEHMTTGVETEPAAEKSHSAVRMQMMMDPANFVFAVTLSMTGDGGAGGSERPGDTAAIGFIGITRPPEIFLIFGRASWGKGYATEALGAFLAAYWPEFPNGLQQMGPGHKDVLQAHVAEENLGSSRVLEKVGFKRIGTMAGRIGNREDVLKRVYEIRRPAGQE